ncbi:hypothetical protein DMUE_3440 [Dictyocoela muelleri]|nr:hypothetical protein DMUE_3440 [Dictyocoela muelleri]
MNYQPSNNTTHQSSQPLDFKKLIKNVKQKSIPEQIQFINQCYSTETQIFKKTFFNLNNQPVSLNYKEIDNRQSIQKEAIQNLKESIIYLQKRIAEIKLRINLNDQKLNFVKKKIMILFKGGNVMDHVDEVEYWHVNNKDNAIDVLQGLRNVSMNLLKDIRNEKKEMQTDSYSR